MKKYPVRLFVAICALFILLSCGSEEKSELQSHFENPPVDARPKSFWTWANGNFDLDQISVEMKEAHEKGMGGYDIWDVGNLSDLENKVPAGPPFMGEESVEAIIHTIKEAGRYNLELGLVLASSWNNGGSWVKPEHGVMGILDTSVMVQGNQLLELELPFPRLPRSTYYNENTLVLLDTNESGIPNYYEDIAVLAYPLNKKEITSDQIISLSKHFHNGILSYQLPEGDWEIHRYVCTGLGVPLKRPSFNSNGRMIDHFSREAQQAHIEYFMGKLAPHFNNNFENTALKYLYNDSYEIKGPVWTPTMIAEFEKRKGYSIIPYLPVLSGKIVENQEISDRFLYDYKQVLSDLMIENHYQYGRELSEAYGLGYYAEGGGPGPPIHDVPVESIKALGALTVPRGEFWYDHGHYDENGFNSLQFVKGIASASHLYNQKYVEAESFTTLYHYQTRWSDLKPYADQAFCEGLNRVVFHTGTHSPPEFGMPGYVYGFGTHVNVRQTWYPKARAWNDYLARCSFMLQQGNFVGDILYYYGDEAPNFAKQRHIKPDLGFGYDYDVLNTEKLLELEVKNGKLTLPHGQEYSLLVLPDRPDMPLHVLEKIEQLLEKGALVSGNKPTRTPGLHRFEENDKMLTELADKLWMQFDSENPGMISHGEGKLYSGVPQRLILYENGIFPDFYFKGENDSTNLNFIHRKTPEADIYFVINQKGESTTAECVFRVKNRIPELWIPETGEVITDLIYSHEDDSTRVALSFEPNDAYFIVFRKQVSSPVKQTISKDGQQIFPSESQFAKLNDYRIKLNTFENPGNYQIAQNGEIISSRTIEAERQITLNGIWKISFPEGYGAPESTTLSQLVSLTQSDIPGVKYFSGIATYQIDFEMETINPDKKYILDLGDVRDLADVEINGDSLGVVWSSPFDIDITLSLKQGTNSLTVDVANLWNNRLVGDGKLPEDERITNSNIVNGPNAWMYPWAEVPLKDAGILGPVKIKVID